MVSTGVLRAVNPVDLAQASGVTKVPRFANPIAPVIRPQLLTTQLMGCCPVCAGGDQAGPVGLSGFIPPDYGSLRGNGSYGTFKILSSGELPPLQIEGFPQPAPTSSGMGKGASGTHAAYYANRSWSHGLRGLGKGASGTHAAYYANRSWSHGLRGLGQAFGVNYPTGNVSVSGTIGAGGQTIPGVGTADPTTTAAINDLINSSKAWLGSGRQEADLIVPKQNALVAQLGTITNQFLTGTSPTLQTLQNLYTQVWILAVGFMEFVLQKAFTDRRASGQALNTIMPYINGACGYAVPLGAQAQPSQQNCMHWGVNSLGGDGTDGMLGAISRAMVNAGGAAPVFMNIDQAANSGIPATAAAAVNPATGQIMSTAATPFGLPATVGGIPTTTLLLIGLGVLLISRMK